MDPATISAMIAAIGLLTNASGSANATGVAQQNLQFQRDQAQQQERLSTATKTDANGNKTVYDPATNSWKEVLTPLQQAIENASQSEQLKSVTTDAARKRELAQREEGYSQDAGTPYNAAVQGYINNQPHSEAAINDEIGTLMQNANQSSGKENQALLTRQALRLGRGADIPALIKATDDQIGASTPSIMLKARQQALQEHQSRVQAHDQQYLPEISAFKQIIDNGGGNSTQRFSDLAPRVAATEQNSQNAMLTALQNANSGINTASKNLQSAEGQKIDFGTLVKAVGATGKKADGTDATTDANPWQPDYGNIADYLKSIPNFGSNDFIS